MALLRKCQDAELTISSFLLLDWMVGEVASESAGILSQERKHTPGLVQYWDSKMTIIVPSDHWQKSLPSIYSAAFNRELT